MWIWVRLIHGKVTRHLFQIRSASEGLSRTFINEDEQPSKKATARTTPASDQGAGHPYSTSATRAQGASEPPRRFCCRLRADRIHLTPDGHHRPRDQVRQPWASIRA